MADKKTEILAIIPARGKSKSIPRKNILHFGGHPLIAWSIAAAKQASLVTRVIVSTDDEEIAEIARKYGAETPFLRPMEYAGDLTPDLPVFHHALTWLAQYEKYKPEIVVQLRPTSPIRPPSCVDDAINILLEHAEAHSVRGVVPAGQNPYKMWSISNKGAMRPILTVTGLREAYNAPRQELPAIYWQTGHVDAIRSDVILTRRSMSGDVIFPLVIDPIYTVDIDTELDWKNAERLVQDGNLTMVKPNGCKRKFPQDVALIVFDFDGVFTDDRVIVDQDGREAITASRSDGYGIGLLHKQKKVQMIVMTLEKNPVVAARCAKLKLEVQQGVEDKKTALAKLLAEKNIPPEKVIYMGNDLNDLPCFSSVGFSAVPADAHVKVKNEADLVLTHPGGYGAVRELCELVLKNAEKDTSKRKSTVPL